MTPKNALLQCSLCLGSVGKQKWTESFISVSIEDGKVKTEHVHHDYRTRYLPGSYPSGWDWFTPTECFLIHEGCLGAVKTLSSSNPNPARLFRLCQSLQNDYERSFAHPRTFAESSYELKDCADPSAPLVDLSLFDRFKTIALPSGVTPFPLPPELVLMLLEELSSKDLISFLGSSIGVSCHAQLYCRNHPERFAPLLNSTSTTEEAAGLLRAIQKTYTDKQYRELDERWKLLEKLGGIAQTLRDIPDDLAGSTWSFKQPPEMLSHQFGFERLIADVPADVYKIETYRRRLRKAEYVCGIGWKSASKGKQFFGRMSGVRKEINFDGANSDLRYLTDQLGVRDLVFGGPVLQSGTENVEAWASLSVRRPRSQLEIICDSLKFRSIRWLPHPTDDLEFGELVLIRGADASSSCTLIGADTYHTAFPDRDPSLIQRHGQFAVEAIPFRQGLTAITVYDDDCNFGKIGMRTHYADGTSDLVGWESKHGHYFPLQSGKEYLTEIDVQTQYLSTINRDIVMTMKTSRGRSQAFKCKRHPSLNDTPTRVRTLRPREGQKISGLYFRIGKDSTMESIGLLCEKV